MTGVSKANCTPSVEMAHYLDPLDYDDGPLQSLAPRVKAEPVREAAPAVVSGATGTASDAGYPLDV